MCAHAPRATFARAAGTHVTSTSTACWRSHHRRCRRPVRAACTTTADRGDTTMRTYNSRNWPVLLLLPVATGAWAADHRVTVGGTTGGGAYEYPVMSFSPQALTIALGDTVTFVNAGGVHNVYAEDGSFRCAQGCDGQGGNGALSGESWSATVAFDTPGSFPYICQAHAGMGMRGTITVQGAAPAEFNPDQHGLSGSWADATTDRQGVVMED